MGEQEPSEQVCVVHDVEDGVFRIEFHTGLSVVSDFQGFAALDHASKQTTGISGCPELVFRFVGTHHVRCIIPCQEVYECAFPRSVAAHYPDFLVSLEIVGEMAEIISVSVSERHVFAVDDFRAKPCTPFHVIECQGFLSVDLLRPVFQFVECVDAVFGLPCPGLRRTAYPFQFSAQNVPHLVGFGVVVGYPFLSFFEIVLIIAAVGVYGSVIHFHDRVAHMVQKIPVMSHHQQRALGS